MTKTKPQISVAIVPHAVQVELFGAKTCHVKVGSVVRLLPHCDLWMRGAKSAEVRQVLGSEAEGFRLRVRPLISGRPVKGPLHSILPDHVDTTPGHG